MRSRLDWKYALSLELTDPGFDYTVLSEFRIRLVAGRAEQCLLDLVLAQARDRSWLKTWATQRTDSTQVLAAVRALTRLTAVGETLHHTLNVLAEVTPDWLWTQALPAEWIERYAHRVEKYRLPKACRRLRVTTVTAATRDERSSRASTTRFHWQHGCARGASAASSARLPSPTR